MKIRTLIIKEILHRKLRLVAGIVAVAIAVGVLAGAVVLLRAHDAHTERILQQARQEAEAELKELEDQMRRAMLKLGFNLLILPEEQELRDWYSEDYATEYMPEDYVHKLAQSGIILVRHFFPILQQKVFWPEKKRTIILVGTRGEVPNPYKRYRAPMVQPVPEGTIVLGHELHTSAGISEGETVQLMGRQFTVHKCYDERGSKDDITAWISLEEAQDMLDKQGKINALLALECLCPGIVDPAQLRQKLAEILPGTRVIEKGTRKLAREEARLKLKENVKARLEQEEQHRRELRAERERAAALLVPLVMVLCAAWIGLLMFFSVRDRRPEIGIMRAMGYRSRHILTLFVSKTLIFGVVGGAVGLALGALGGSWLAGLLESAAQPAAGSTASPWSLLGPGLAAGLLLAACALSVVAGWMPALSACYQDPASILRRE